MSIGENLARISAQVAGRATLIAVSKTKPASDILEAYTSPANHRDFGENYIQELVEKASMLRTQCPHIRWHFIGSLQSNKIKALVEGVGPQLASIQTIDSVSKLEKVVKALEAHANFNALVELYLQVNVSGEESKHGFKALDELKEAFTRFAQLNAHHCRLVGLMSIGEPGESERDFSRMLQLQSELSAQFGEIKLSMGMSDDYELALEMGSNCIRVGSAIFGSRE